jgi:hypothetical protein
LVLEVVVEVFPRRSFLEVVVEVFPRRSFLEVVVEVFPHQSFREVVEVLRHPLLHQNHLVVVVVAPLALEGEVVEGEPFPPQEVEVGVVLRLRDLLEEVSVLSFFTPN